VVVHKAVKDLKALQRAVAAEKASSGKGADGRQILIGGLAREAKGLAKLNAAIQARKVGSTRLARRDIKQARSLLRRGERSLDHADRLLNLSG
jgi:hypothetical protein